MKMLFALVLVPVVLAAQASAEFIPYSDAKPIFDALRDDLLPPELRGLTPAQREAAWPGWVMRRDAAIRARVAEGDEDSVINLLQFGTIVHEAAAHHRTAAGRRGDAKGGVARRLRPVAGAEGAHRRLRRRRCRPGHERAAPVCPARRRASRHRPGDGGGTGTPAPLPRRADCRRRQCRSRTRACTIRRPGWRTRSRSSATAVLPPTPCSGSTSRSTRRSPR